MIKPGIGDTPVSRPRGWDRIWFWVGKLAFLTLAFAIPLLHHSASAVIGFYLLTSATLGLVLAIVFQLAHCVEEADFPDQASSGGRVDSGWAAHQVQTTVDFAQRNRLLTWYLGGLNFQIEHHLFPKISHVHYPRIAQIVKVACADYGVRYAAHDGMVDALRSHWRWLRRMGRPCPTA
jgi:linoleoyl-CoA desaturase